MVGVSGKLKHT